MALQEILTIAATLLSPLIALQVSTWIAKIQQARRRKLEIFKTLMSTRGERLSPAHVQALNMIDVEFYGNDKKLTAIVRAWHAYHDHLSAPPEQIRTPHWGPRQDELFIDLLLQMANYLGYDFDRTALKNLAYSPVAYGNAENDQLAIRRGLASIFRGEQAFPITIAAKEAPQPLLAERTKPAQPSDLTPREREAS